MRNKTTDKSSNNGQMRDKTKKVRNKTITKPFSFGGEKKTPKKLTTECNKSISLTKSVCKYTNCRMLLSLFISSAILSYALILETWRYIFKL